MTPEDLALDFADLLVSQFLLYRLARSKYANLSGAGAANAPGRWNKAGQEVLYTSTEMGVPILERLVHTPKDLIPSNLAMMTLSLSGSWAYRADPDAGSATTAFDEKTGAQILVLPVIKVAKQLVDESSFIPRPALIALAVPSVVVPVWNFVLYPRSEHFWKHVTLQSIDPFDFDPRLFPDDTPLEV